MSATDDLARIQLSVRNVLPVFRSAAGLLAGVLGEAPSRYSKSPSMWNAAFRTLEWDAIYLPFDVEESRLPDFLNALLSAPSVVGVNVTVPYKVKVMPYLNGLDATAARIGAVNTIVRAPGGQLVGFNTDGAGFLESIQKVLPGQEKPLMPGLKGMKVLIIGAGGSARAVAFSLAEVLDYGQLWICNRTPEPAASLAGDVRRTFPGARAVREEDLPRLAPDADLIVNCSTKGQGGMMRTTEGKVTILEPYSALAPAHPAVIEDPQKATAEIYRSWLKASLADIEGNNRASWRMMLSIPSEVPFCDLIYFPEETVFLRHARLSGHRSVNGRGMLACQAVESFFAICRTRLDEERLDPDETRRRVIESMWPMDRS